MPIIITLSAAEGETLADLRSEIVARGFDYLDRDAAGRGRIRRALNTAIDKLCDEERWPFLEASATGPSGITLAPLLAVAEVRFDDKALPFRSSAELRTVEQDLAAIGDPVCFYLENDDMVRTWPVTEDDLQIRFWQAPAPLVDDDDICVIPRRWSYVIIDAAVRELEKDRHNWPAVNALATDWTDGVARMRDSLLSQQHSDHEATLITGDWA